MRRGRAVARIAGLVAGLGCAVAACEGPREAGPRRPGLAAALDEARISVQAPGAIVGVRYPDGAIQIEAVGLADLAGGRPMETDDAYFLGSISKVYTAALILRLAETGALSLDDPLSRFLPDFPRAEEISIRQLLGHTSGLKDFYLYLYLRPDREEMIERITRTWTQEEMLKLAARFGHWFDPGTDWAYSNANFFLLGVVAERATGSTLAGAYRHFLLDSLGLDRTWLTLYEERRADLPITGYMGRIAGWDHSEMFGELGPTTLLDRSNLEWGAGGLAAPAEEALVFLAALVNAEVLLAESLEQMLSFRPTPALGAQASTVASAAEPDLESGYGLGLVRMKRAGYEAIGHGGLFTGHTAGLWYLPRDEVTVALFLNRGFIGQRLVLDRIVTEIRDTVAAD